MAGNTRPTNGTKIDGKYAAAIVFSPLKILYFNLLILNYTPSALKFLVLK